MIISASRRTDIPAFHSDWFYEGIKNGYVECPNPMYPSNISKVSLTKEDVDCIVFWTKNPRPMMNRLSELEGYYYYFQYTLNDYFELEPNIPSRWDRMSTLVELSDMIGRDKIVWRYDPILIKAGKFTYGHIIDNFKFILLTIHPYINRCVISFIDIYDKNKKACEALGIREPNEMLIHHICRDISQIAKSYNINIYTCALKLNLSEYGILHGKCIDDELISAITNKKIKSTKDTAQRELCGCIKSRDIGMYGTCKHGCVYCYAG